MTDLSNPFYLAYFSENLNPIQPGTISGPWGSGFRPDGSYYYYGILHVFKKNIDFEFNDTFQRIENQGYRFEHLSQPNPKGLDYLSNLKQTLIKHEKKIIFILPPYADEVWQKIAEYKDNYRYIWQLKNNMDLFDYDFTDPKTFNGQNSCEFIDGAHGSDVTFTRMLLKISQNAEHKQFLSLNTKTLNQLLTLNAGTPLFKTTHLKKYSALERCNQPLSPH